MKTSFIIIILVIVFLVSSCCAPAPTAVGQTTVAINPLERDYASLIVSVMKYNSTGTGPVNAWLMNSEHLFLGIDDATSPDSLVSRAKIFSRRDGGLTMLLNRASDPQVSPDEILSIAEILVYYGQDEEPGDELVKSPAAADRLKLYIDQGQIRCAESKFPEAPIRRQLVYALIKAGAT